MAIFHSYVELPEGILSTVSKNTIKHQKSRTNATTFEQAMVHVAMAQLGARNGQRVLVLGGRRKGFFSFICVAKVEDLWGSVITGWWFGT